MPCFPRHRADRFDRPRSSYVVINYDDHFKPDKDFNIQPLSVVAVVCGGKVTYGVWADTNALGSMGEVSLRLARTCYPNDNLSGNLGHDEADVLCEFATRPAVRSRLLDLLLFFPHAAD